MVMKRSGRGSVGRSFSKKKRYDNDVEFREKMAERRKEYYNQNKPKVRKYHKEYMDKLKKDLDKRCKKCNKLLHPNNQSGLCKKHFYEAGGSFNYIMKKNKE